MENILEMSNAKIYIGECKEVLQTLPDKYFHTVVTSPPYYGLRDYGTATWIGGDPNCKHAVRKNKSAASTLGGGKKTTNHAQEGFVDVCKHCGAVREDMQLGLEKTPEEYIARLVDIFREVRRVLKDDGTVWLNIGDSYASDKSRYNARSQTIAGGSDRDDSFDRKPDLFKYAKNTDIKNKDLIGIPWMLAFALRADGWYLRRDIIWNKLNPMPESVKDRPTSSHEYIFLLSKNSQYYYDYEAIWEPALYDGRQDTVYNGSVKSKDSDLIYQYARSHERWPQKIRGFKSKDQLENTVPQHHGADIAPNKFTKRIYPNGENQTLHDCPHSGYYKADGSPLFNINGDGVPARNKRSVWTLSTKPYPDAHFATYPPDLVEPCILAGSPVGGQVLDIFSGAASTGIAALSNGRFYTGIELSRKYADMSWRRLRKVQLPLIPNGEIK